MDILDREKIFFDVKSAQIHRKPADEADRSHEAIWNVETVAGCDRSCEHSKLGNFLTSETFRRRWQRKIDVPYFPMYVMELSVFLDVYADPRSRFHS